jgi:hypothetical protein
MENWRELHAKTAMNERLDNALKDFAAERQVLLYLESKGQTGAAQRVKDNIVKMEARIEKYRKEAG